MDRQTPPARRLCEQCIPKNFKDFWNNGPPFTECQNCSPGPHNSIVMQNGELLKEATPSMIAQPTLSPMTPAFVPGTSQSSSRSPSDMQPAVIQGASASQSRDLQRRNHHTATQSFSGSPFRGRARPSNAMSQPRPQQHVNRSYFQIGPWTGDSIRSRDFIMPRPAYSSADAFSLGQPRLPVIAAVPPLLISTVGGSIREIWRWKRPYTPAFARIAHGAMQLGGTAVNGTEKGPGTGPKSRSPGFLHLGDSQSRGESEVDQWTGFAERTITG